MLNAKWKGALGRRFFSFSIYHLTFSIAFERHEPG
jgi:hypothetical protein